MLYSVTGALPQEIDYTYTPDGLIATQVAVNTSTGNQTTTYTYGSTLTGSDIARNDLLVNVAYPDSTGSSDTVTTAYNRLGQKKTVTDQRGVVHTYEYDKLGRQTEDKVTSLGSSGIIDNYVLRIQQAFDVRGMVYQVTSHSATSGGSVRNQCEYHYNAFAQLEEEFQEHGGSVQAGTPSVQYQYASGDDGSGNQTNTIRQTGITYPDGRQIDYEYGSGTLNDQLNRADTITDTTNSQRLAEYTYLGSGLAVRVYYPEPDVWLDLYGGTPGTFAGLDRFNRVTDQRWQNDVSGTPTDIDRYTYTYDASGNRLTRGNPLHTAFDETYGYDTLNRLISMDRGSSGATRTEAWTLDEQGNWQFYDTSTGGTPDLSQTRSANVANEITNITSTPTWADPVYDAAGNMTEFVKPSAPSSNLTATYDAWNRIVKVVDGSNTVVEYRYDGKRRRILHLEYTGGTLTGSRKFYFDSNWREVEVRLGVSTAADRQFVWSTQEQDLLICRDDATPQRLYGSCDAHHSLTAVLDTFGVVQERYEYMSYGAQELLTPTFGTRSVSSFGWDHGFEGLRLDGDLDGWFARNRSLLTATGAWNRRDPVDASQNLYEVLDSNPVNFSDPYGLACDGPRDGWFPYLPGPAGLHNDALYMNCLGKAGAFAALHGLQIGDPCYDEVMKAYVLACTQTSSGPESDLNPQNGAAEATAALRACRGVKPAVTPAMRRQCFAACVSGMTAWGGTCYWPCAVCSGTASWATVIGCVTGCGIFLIPRLPSWLQRLNPGYRLCVAGCFVTAGFTLLVTCPACAGCVLSESFWCAFVCGY